MRISRVLGVAVMLTVLVPLLSPAAVSQGAPAAPRVTRTAQELRVLYSFAAPEVGAAQVAGYQLLRMPGLGLYAPPGEPLVPMRRAVVLVPADKEAVGVEVVPGKKVALGRFSLQPAAEPVPLDRQGQAGEPVPNPEVYSRAPPDPGRLRSEPMLQWKSG
ncbi:MAG: hypothetical protein K6T75_08010, partial [Acetobacteraceae bacterium]|nr:hypothetical protein [Acetobacteraceae bacterium]